MGHLPQNAFTFFMAQDLDHHLDGSISWHKHPSILFHGTFVSIVITFTKTPENPRKQGNSKKSKDIPKFSSNMMTLF
jgi:hypothetical protein